jgi:effector-binding domain-containing protein
MFLLLCQQIINPAAAAVVKPCIMKIVKWIVIVLVAIVVLVFAAAIILPKDMNTERTVTINAPPSVVFNNVADFTKWAEWSAWKEMDSSSKETYFGTKGEAGSGYSWVGQKTGEGKITATVIKPNDEILFDLEFIKPFTGKANGGFKFSAENGGTKVVWSYHSHMDMPMNVMSAMMKGEMAKSLDRGLEKLKALSEKEATAMPKYEVKETTLPAMDYLMVRKQLKWEDINSQFFADGFKKVGEEMTKNKQKMAGPPSELVFTWEETAKKADLAAAVPVDHAKPAKGEVQAYKFDASKAISVDYYGPYNKMMGAYDALDKYVAAKGLKKKVPTVEQYITDPMNEPDTSKWLTKIYYPVE